MRDNERAARGRRQDGDMPRTGRRQCGTGRGQDRLQDRHSQDSERAETETGQREDGDSAGQNGDRMETVGTVEDVS